MHSKLNELVGRKAVLISRSAFQREELARTYARFEGPARVVDSIFATARTVKRRPGIIASASLFLAATRWRKIARLPKRLYQGWLLMKMLRDVRAIAVRGR